MNVGPLRRITAALGLVALVPITWLLITGALTPEEAAIRAVIVVIVVVALGNLMRAVLTRLLHRVERRAGDLRGPDGRGGDARAAGRATDPDGVRDQGIVGQTS